MGKLRFNYRSQVLCQNVEITVVIPTNDLSFYDQTKRAIEGVPNPAKKFIYARDMSFQTVYLMHGGGDDDSILYRKTNVERYAENNIVMLVTPSLPNSYFADTAYGVDYSTFVTDELPLVIQTLFPSSPMREDTFIVGYAMGGNGAMVTALKRPDLYSYCVDISGGVVFNTNLDEMRETINSGFWSLYSGTFGDPAKLEGSKYDIAAIAKRNIAEHVEVPKFLFYAGSEEGRIRNRVYYDYKNLSEFGYDAAYEELQGYGHEWKLWDMMLDEVLSRKLPLKRAPIYLNEK